MGIYARGVKNGDTTIELKINNINILDDVS